MYRISLPPCILALALVYATCFIMKIDAGGKGKGNRQGHIIIQNEVKDRNPPVPIYIPVPIPMPMGLPAGGGGKSFNHHHHQQQHNNEGDNEVKKIYLLQPMPRAHPTPQMKGGFIGPVQTHIHVPAPVVQQHQQGKTHHDGHSRPTQNEQTLNEGYEGGTKSGQSHHHHHSNMKILPIVVIPPIAPIQMPHSQHHEKKGSEHQESRTYGGSVGGSTYRKAFGPRGKLRSSRLSDQSTDAMDHFGFAASRARSSRDRNRIDDFGDDYEMSSPHRSQRYYHQSSSRQAPMSAGSRRWNGNTGARRKMISAADEHQGVLQRSAGSIKDIIEQQRHVQFDDDSASTGDGSSNRQSAADCCQEFRPRSRYQTADSNIPVDTVAGGRMPNDPSPYVGEESYLESRDPRQLLRNIDLNSLYYDRDLQSTDEHLFSSSRSSDYNNPATLARYEGMSNAPLVGRRKYLEDGESLLDDDEWAFDSVKSVSHLSSPSSNVTSTIGSHSKNTTTISATSTSISTSTSTSLKTTKAPQKVVE